MTTEEKIKLVNLVCYNRDCLLENYECPIHAKTIDSCYEIGERDIIYICMKLYHAGDKKFLESLKKHDKSIFNKYCLGVEYGI